MWDFGLRIWGRRRLVGAFGTIVVNDSSSKTCCGGGVIVSFGKFAGACLLLIEWLPLDYTLVGRLLACSLVGGALAGVLGLRVVGLGCAGFAELTGARGRTGSSRGRELSWGEVRPQRPKLSFRF